MKKEKLLKLVLAIIMGVILIVMSTNVLALSDDDFYLDLTNTVNTNTPDTTPTPAPTPDTNTNINTNTNTNTNAENYNTNLPKAGIAENTMAGVVVTILAILSVYAYRKIKYYKDI